MSILWKHEFPFSKSDIFIHGEENISYNEKRAGRYICHQKLSDIMFINVRHTQEMMLSTPSWPTNNFGNNKNRFQNMISLISRESVPQV